MPWLTIIVTLLSFFASKKSGASSTKAALIAGLAGAGTYYASHETEWGKANLGALDGLSSNTSGPVVNGQGSAVTTQSGGTLSTVVGGVSDVLKSWGGTGTAAVVGTTAVATSSSLRRYIPWIIGGLGLILLTRN